MNYTEPLIESRHQLGLKIKRLRQEQRLSQAQLGLMVGRDRSYISRIERGRCNATFETLVILADGFGISLSQLLEGIAEPKCRGNSSLPATFAMPKER